MGRQLPTCSAGEPGEFALLLADPASGLESENGILKVPKRDGFGVNVDLSHATETTPE